ncbi:MAG: hypothetical protein LBN12_02965, partial [Clostridiales Family XIII bacterium]|nr:hypothetical protein [Clostridiales Family XIII bacterium]
CFRRERLDEGAYRKATDLPGVVLELRVSPAQFQAVSAMLGDFLLNYYRYEFNCLGLAKQAIGRYHMKDNQFFCSEFVYHVLHSCGICDLKRPRGAVRPQDLLTIGRIVYYGDLLRYSGESVQTLQSSTKNLTGKWSNMLLPAKTRQEDWSNMPMPMPVKTRQDSWSDILMPIRRSALG